MTASATASLNSPAPDFDAAKEAKRLLAQYELDRRRAARDPLFLISHMSAPDERTAKNFTFEHLRTDEERWGWQRDFIREIHGSHRLIILKARQLGATWLTCAYGVWVMLYMRGSLSLFYRQKEQDAIENVMRAWRLLQSLPPHLLNHGEVEIPAKGSDPRGGRIEVRFPDKSLSRIVAESSASASGHGQTAAYVSLDELSRIEQAAEIVKAVQSVAGEQGKIVIPSTANGVSNPESGEGNYYHYIWSHAEELRFDTTFLPWNLHPDRDQNWYDNSPEVRGLRTYERAEQYPSNADEAFALTTNSFFDQEEISYYGQLVPKPLYRFEFEKESSGQARWKRRSDGQIRVYREPDATHRYAIGVDPSSGVGLDFSAVSVIDLTNMEIAAEMYERCDPDLLAFQLHYLGRWYGTRSGCPADARIAIENQGGYGIAVITPLRDGREDRPPYPNLHRHVLTSSVGSKQAKTYGVTMSAKARPQILSGLDKAVREGHDSKGEQGLPYLTRVCLDEARMFIRSSQPGQSIRGPWPRAMDGSHDDMLMALAIALEMYRLYGTHPEMDKRLAKRPKRKYKPAYPWQHAA